MEFGFLTTGTLLLGKPPSFPPFLTHPNLTLRAELLSARRFHMWTRELPAHTLSLYVLGNALQERPHPPPNSAVHPALTCHFECSETMQLQAR